ncbi:MAG: type II secretion system protein [Candidatus Omnitrophica bacterium]|jgi:type IV pilus assembly protein PilE|nr:type II secretion system protein [Candidatus Omnitrophota bacterium]MDD5661316.1 type II secretion system protein [Candidatus Omnitrophota bacterium]
MHKGFTLVELIIVITVIGILVAFASPQFAVTKERALDREAKATIALIQAAEKIYKMEEGPYYPSPAGSTSNIANINANLRLSLPVSSSAWTYTVNSAAQTATATRSGRTWTATFTGGDPSCSGAGCP